MRLEILWTATPTLLVLWIAFKGFTIVAWSRLRAVYGVGWRNVLFANMLPLFARSNWHHFTDDYACPLFHFGQLQQRSRRREYDYFVLALC